MRITVIHQGTKKIFDVATPAELLLAVQKEFNSTWTDDDLIHALHAAGEQEITDGMTITLTSPELSTTPATPTPTSDPTTTPIHDSKISVDDKKSLPVH